MSEHSILDIEKKDQADHRPLLLKALCILSLVGSAALIIAKIVAGISDPGRFFYSHIVLAINLFSLACNIVTIIGAIMMWKLKREGFWIYSVAEIAPVLLSLVLLIDSSTKLDMNTSGAFGAGLVVRIAFIAMYYRYYRIFR